MITSQTITVDAVNHLPHGTVRRAPEGFAHAILLDQFGKDDKWLIVDLYGPVNTDGDDGDDKVATWPIVYVPAPDEVWEVMNFGHPRDPEDGPPDQHGELLAVEGLGEEVSEMDPETEQTEEQQGRGDNHNGPTFPDRSS